MAKKKARRSGADASHVQTLIFDPKKFSVSEAKKWASDHDFHSGKVDVSGTGSIRLRQEDPGRFRQGSFRTKQLAPGVQAVFGRRNRGV
jgi:hypothetical protein